MGVQIWQIADVEDKGFLTPPGFYIILRLIGYAQAGRTVSAELALKGVFIRLRQRFRLLTRPQLEAHCLGSKELILEQLPRHSRRKEVEDR